MSVPKAKKEAVLRGVLFYLSGEREGQAIKLRRDATLFGRDKGDVIINDTEISATHCQIQNINGQYHLFDMNSTNGTHVNGQRIIKCKLNSDDLIVIGKTTLKFSLEKESEVRHISTAYQSANQEAKENGQDAGKSAIMGTILDQELKKTKSTGMRLIVTYGDASNEVIDLLQQLVYIGRASSFGKFDQDSETSRKHLMIKINDLGEIFIEDLGSTNGSYLNGQKIQGMHKISSEDLVRVGTSTIRIVKT
jgi:pSer/pThr/pTyr-binding forkhead associated (FHA) protein